MTRRLAALLAVVAALVPVPAAAATSSGSARQQQIQRQIVTLRSQVAEASADEERLLGQLDETDARLDVLNRKVRDLDGQILSTRSELATAQRRLDEAEAQYLEARDRLERARVGLARSQHEMQARAVTAYIHGPAVDGYGDLLLGTSDARQLVARTEYMRAVLQRQAVTVRRYLRLRDAMGGLKATLETSRREALDQRNVVVGRTTVLEDARARQDAVRGQVAGEMTQREGLLAQVRARRGEFEAQITALQAESRSITSLLRTRQAGQAVQVSGRGVLTVPIPGAAITSGFGMRVHPVFGDLRMHTGVDFAARQGTPIRAAHGGQVVFAGPRGGYGNATIIDHGGAVATLYAHQSAILVGEGEHVVTGQVIGLVGATGFATGPHLHFEVRVNGEPVDPLRYL